MLVQVRQDLVAAHDGAQRVGAHAHVVLANRVTLVHRVVRRHRDDLGLGQAELARAVGDAVVGQVALLGLHQVQQRQQGRPRAGVPADDLAGVRIQPGANLITERHYLSTPPITGSMLATAAITSATMPPSVIAASACRLVNEGSRKCTRNGLVPPSLTAWQPSSPRGDSTAVYTCPSGTRNPSVTSLK